MARFCGAAQTPLPTHFLKILCCLATTVVLVSDGSAASFSPSWLSLLGPKHGSKFQVYPEPSPSKNEEYSIAILDISLFFFIWVDDVILIVTIHYVLFQYHCFFRFVKYYYRIIVMITLMLLF